jgi:hypothetical protein
MNYTSNKDSEFWTKRAQLFACDCFDLGRDANYHVTTVPCRGLKCFSNLENQPRHDDDIWAHVIKLGKPTEPRSGLASISDSQPNYLGKSNPSISTIKRDAE